MRLTIGRAHFGQSGTGSDAWADDPLMNHSPSLIARTFYPSVRPHPANVSVSSLPVVAARADRAASSWAEARESRGVVWPLLGTVGV